MSASLPSFTRTFHKETYAAINPTQPALSVKGKTVVVTGVGSAGIGSAVALSFARAGAEKIALIGRNESTVLETKEAINASVPTTTQIEGYVVDISSSESVGVTAHYLRVALGAWDVFVHCADYVPDPTSLAGADTDDDWWTGFEVNIKFVSHFAKHFVPKARPNATYICFSSLAVHMPAGEMKGNASHAASKLAVLKLNEYLAMENPGLRVFNVHPGRVDSPANRKILAQDGRYNKKNKGDESWDSPELCADFCVWLASENSEFLRGRFLWCNWDVKELLARKVELEANPFLLTATINGWPFT